MKDNQKSKSDPNSDWICLNCNNLNYSFRKVCNRCRTCTREENQQNYLQMQYYQMYYQQSYYPNNDTPLSPSSSPNPMSPSSISSLDLHRADETSLTASIESTLISQSSGTCETTSKEWNFVQGESSLIFLLQNAWQGLYSSDEMEQCKGWEQVQNTREQQCSSQQGEGIPLNFDFTFI